MFAMIEVALLEIGSVGPEFALLFGVPDLRPLRRHLKLTVRSRRETEIVVVRV